MKTWSALHTSERAAPKYSRSADIRSSRSPLPWAKPLLGRAGAGLQERSAGSRLGCGPGSTGGHPRGSRRSRVTWYPADTQTSARSAWTSPDRAKSISRCTPPYGSAGLARSRVSTSIRDPCPPACTRGKHLTHVASWPSPWHRGWTCPRPLADEGMSLVDLPLLPLGKGRDLDAERGVECPGDLPAASDPDLVARARAAKAALGERVFVLGHHYQRDEVIQFADVTGDSFKLARDAAARPDAEFIVFCGVHFMAESADILTSPEPAGGPARPRGRLLDGRHGPAAPGRGRLGRMADAASRTRRPGDLHELQRRHQGVLRHATAASSAPRPTPTRAGLGVRPEADPPTGRQGALPARPAPRPQHRGAPRWASASTTAWCGTRCSPAAA